MNFEQYKETTIVNAISADSLVHCGTFVVDIPAKRIKGKLFFVCNKCRSILFI